MQLQAIQRGILFLFVVCFLGGHLPAQTRRPLKPVADKLEPSWKVNYKTVDDRSLQLHIFEPPGHRSAERLPVFLAIHGGGWTGGSIRQFYPFASRFAELGMVGVSLEYRLMDRGSGTTVFDCVRDGRSAIRFLRKHAQQFGIDENQIVVAGGSAGAHIAAGAALFDGVDEVTDDTTISCQPDLLVLYYPVIDTSKQGYGQNKIGDRWRELSPVDHVKAGLPPTILFHGMGDTLTPYAGAKRFHQRMIAAGNSCQLISHPAGGHGYLIFDLELYEEALERTRSFLVAHSVLPGDPPASMEPIKRNGRSTK